MSSAQLTIGWLNTLLGTIANPANKLGPTYASRFLYIGSTIIYYVVSNNIDSDITEPELPSVHASDINFVDKNYLIYGAFVYLYNQPGPNKPYPQNFPSIPPKQLTPTEQIIHTNLLNFLNVRDNDGWKNANNGAPLASWSPDVYPNGNPNSVYIDVDSTQPLSVILPQPKLWTPLRHTITVGPSTTHVIQTYLTPRWGDVITPPGQGGTPLLLTFYTDIAASNFQDPPRTNARTLEIQDMLNIYQGTGGQGLTNQQRVIAEYFQGGKVSPPGIWNVWAIYVLQSANWNNKQAAKFLYWLNTSMFLASITCWKIKFTYKQSRPIQDIRLLSPQSVTTWDSTVVPNNIWKPFQQSTNRTPPFPDFMSGHSTFSDAAAIIYDHFFPQQLDTMLLQPYSATHAQMISPILVDSTTQLNKYSNSVKFIQCDVQSSAVSQGNSTVGFPTSPMTLNFSNWHELAQLSGASRIYGGIHGSTANQTALIIGQQIGKDVIVSKSHSPLTF